MRLAFIGLSVGAQHAEMRRLDAVGQMRALDDRETAMLAELIRLDSERERDAERRLRAQRMRAQTLLARLDARMGMAA